VQLERFGMFFELSPLFLRKFGEIFEIETTIGVDTLMEKEIRAFLDFLKR